MYDVIYLFYHNMSDRSTIDYFYFINYKKYYYTRIFFFNNCNIIEHAYTYLNFIILIYGLKLKNI